MEVADMKMLRFSLGLGVTRMDKIRNEYIRGTAHIGVRANIHLEGQTKFCPNGERIFFVTRPRQGEKNELSQSLF